MLTLDALADEARRRAIAPAEPNRPGEHGLACSDVFLGHAVMHVDGHQSASDGALRCTRGRICPSGWGEHGPFWQIGAGEPVRSNTTIDGAEVTNASQSERRDRREEPRRRVRLTCLRAGKTKTATVTLGRRPS